MIQSIRQKSCVGILIDLGDARTKKLLKMTQIRLSKRPLLFEPFFEDFMARERRHQAPSLLNGKPAPCNISEYENHWQIDLMAPGRKKAEFKIDLDENTLSISAETPIKEEVEKGKKFAQEFQLNHFNRSFKLPKDIDMEHISAMYEDGILRVSLPKATPEKTSKKEIAIT